MGDADILQSLLKGGADPNKGCKDFHSPLHRAAKSSPLSIVKLLLEAGASPNTCALSCLSNDGCSCPVCR